MKRTEGGESWGGKVSGAGTRELKRRSRSEEKGKGEEGRQGRRESSVLRGVDPKGSPRRDWIQRKRGTSRSRRKEKGGVKQTCPCEG